jgi:hypothetical protein
MLDNAHDKTVPGVWEDKLVENLDFDFGLMDYA